MAKFAQEDPLGRPGLSDNAYGPGRKLLCVSAPIQI